VRSERKTAQMFQNDLYDLLRKAGSLIDGPENRVAVLSVLPLSLFRWFYFAPIIF